MIILPKRIYTEQQEKAIDARGGSVLVSAAAGSGKTSVLTERVIRLITDKENPIRADRLLIVTFTKASAAEMKQRIISELQEYLKEDSHNTELKRQLMLLRNADICTIDSFCSKIVRENFFELGVKRDLRIGSESELAIASNDALDEALEELYQESEKQNGNDDFNKLADALATVKSDNNLRSVILSIYVSILSHPFPIAWIENAVKMYETDLPFKETEWGKVAVSRLEHINSYMGRLLKYILRVITERLVDFEGLASAILAATSKPKGEDKKILTYVEKLNAFKTCFEDYKKLSEKLSKELSWNEIVTAISEFSPTSVSLPSKVPEGEEELKKEIANYREELVSAVKEIKDLFSRTEEECKEEIKDSASLARGLCKAIKRYDEKFREIKNDRGIADFSDLEHMTLNLLLEEKDGKYVRTKQSIEIAAKYDEIIIDEYQDTNMVQDMIFTSVSNNEDNLFTVGDVKQSIYRFREAMPEIFLNRRENYRKKNRKNSDSKNYPPIFLSGNFRSRKGVISSVNFIFEQIMSETVGQVKYDDEEKLIAKADYSEIEEPETEYHIVASKPENPWQIDEANHIADIIENTVGKLQIKDKNSTRLAKYSDICILMRNLQNNIDTYADVFEQRGIPVSRNNSGNLFERSEIKLLISFITAVDNPQKDIPLTSIMMSPVYGFTPDDMAKLRLANRSGKIYSTVIEYIGLKNPEDELLQKKCIDFNNEMYFYRKLSSTVPSDTFLDVFFARSGFLSIVGAELDGEARIKNVRKLLNLAREYEKNGFRGLSGFIRMLERLKETGGVLSSSQNKSDGDVKIITIHSSKGLEFPICILAGTAAQRNSDANAVVYHPTLGIAFKSYDRENMLSKTTEVRTIVSMEKKREAISEEMRILYVALTRAKEKLYLVNTVNETKTRGVVDWFLSLVSKLPIYDELNDSDNTAIDPYAVESCKTFAQWIALCALRHPSMSAQLNSFGIEHIETIPTDSIWKVVVVDSDSIEYEKESEDKIIDIAIDKELEKKLTENIETKYKYQDFVAIPTKVSASSVSHKSTGKSFIVKTKPKFMNTGKIKGASRGTAFHEFLHYADIFSDSFNMTAELKRLVSNGFLSQEQADAIDRNAVKKFMSGELFARMKSSERIMREYRFAVMIPTKLAEIAVTDETADTPIFMQGAIDCAFIENGKAVIVDYKTDRIDSVESLAESYSKQLLLYKNALEQSEEIEVSECIIYSLELGEQIRIC